MRRGRPPTKRKLGNVLDDFQETRVSSPYRPIPPSTSSASLDLSGWSDVVEYNEGVALLRELPRGGSQKARKVYEASVCPPFLLFDSIQLTKLNRTIHSLLGSRIAMNFLMR